MPAKKKKQIENVWNSNIKSKADQGDAEAQYLLGNLYDIGQDVLKSKRLMSDLINDRWGGASTLHYASSGITKAWKTQFQRRSPAYTTDWNEVSVVTT